MKISKKGTEVKNQIFVKWILSTVLQWYGVVEILVKRIQEFGKYKIWNQVTFNNITVSVPIITAFVYLKCIR